MIPRRATSALERLGQGFPVVAVTGPRQSGKTTLARASYPDKPYVSLEAPDERAFATDDPRGFLARFPDGAVFDEVQRVPELLSYLQGIVDDAGTMGMFVLTGSQQPALSAQLAQSLAGRVGQLELLPLSGAELHEAGLLGSRLDDAVYRGGYPAPFDRDVDPTTWLANYVATYVERDVRQLLNVRDLDAFTRFVRLCAGRTAQLVNFTSLANDTGVAVPTVQQWLSVLQATYIVTLLQPNHANLTTRAVKTPKLHFIDSGLAAYLIGITDSSMLATHPLRGALVETYVVGEAMKGVLNRAGREQPTFQRDKLGREVDLILPAGSDAYAIEVKAGATFSGSWIAPLVASLAQQGRSNRGVIVYGGDDSYERSGIQVLGWRDATTWLDEVQAWRPTA